jgi:hypothetical protein
MLAVLEDFSCGDHVDPSHKLAAVGSVHRDGYLIEEELISSAEEPPESRL